MTNQASEDNIGCEYCSGEDDKPGWKGSYSDDGAIGYSVCTSCNLDAKVSFSSSDGLLNKSDEDVKLDEALGYITMVWDESSVFGQPPDYSHIYLTGKQEAKEAIQTIIRTEKLKLLAELDKSMPTAEQLTTKYGYHMPEKQYGYKLGLHDIREVIEAERKRINKTEKQ